MRRRLSHSLSLLLLLLALLLPAPAALAATAANTLSLSQAAGPVTYEIGSDVSAEDATLIRRAIALAQRALGDAGPFNVRAGAAYLPAGGVTDADAMADAEPGQMTIYTSIPYWADETPAGRQLLILHEYYHVLQYYLAGDPGEDFADEEMDPDGPRWLIEGSADYVAARVAAEAGLTTFAEERALAVEQAIEFDLSLREVQTMAQSASPELYNAPYALGFLATELLAPMVPNDPYLLGYWKALSEGLTYEDAFKRTFGVSLEEFYTRFETYRRNGFR